MTSEFSTVLENGLRLADLHALLLGGVCDEGSTPVMRPDARLVLVGNPDQVASVEAGAVLADLVSGRPSGARSSGPAACANDFAQR